MTKRKITYAVLALLTLGFSACQQDDDFALQEQEIRVAFTTDVIKTRANTLGTGDVWENGDQVKIERTIKYDSDYYTYTASVAENGTPTWTLDKKLYWNGEEEHILAAFYPAVGQDDYRSFELPEDQSSLEKLKSADCMNAVWVGKPTAGPINFQMKHRLSMITINYDFASEFTNATIDYAQVIPSDPFVMFDAKDGGKMDEPFGVFGTTIDAYHDAVKKRYTTWNVRIPRSRLRNTKWHNQYQFCRCTPHLQPSAYRRTGKSNADRHYHRLHSRRSDRGSNSGIHPYH